MKTFNDYFAALSEQDQKALKLLALFCGPLLLYFIILKPGYSYYNEAKESHLESSQLLTWIEQNKSKVQTTQVSKGKSPELPLSQYISTSAETKKISITRLQPQGDKGVRIWMNEVSFSSLMEYLSELSNNGLTISSITVDKTTNPGVVNAQCLINNA